MSGPVSLFEPDGDAVVATDHARGPWSPDALHGGPVAALLGGMAEAEGDLEAPDGVTFAPVRVTVELLRPVPVHQPLRTRATVVRNGRKIQLVDAELRATDGTVLALARLLRQRDEDVPAPSMRPDEPPPPPPPATATPRLDESGYEAYHSHGVEHRFVRGSFEEPGPATDWIRLVQPVLPGVETTPLQRVLGAADFGNGISRVVDFASLLFINPDLTVHLHRLPAGEWVCLEAVTWMEQRGTALAESRLWDEQGALGRALQSLLVDRRT